MDCQSQASLEVLSRDECLSQLATAQIGRVGVSIGALPAILPVNFTLLREQIIFRTVPGTKLDAATAHRVVAFEVDDYARDGSWGWSVLIQGVASEITDPAELAEVEALALCAWAFRDGAADRCVRIEPAVVTGRRFGQPATASVGHE